MATNKQTEATELLQELGLKQYEAKCLVALTRMPQGTAKEISEVTDVPRTRVYDAIRVLEVKGLVEVQHSSPRRYRAIPIEEATSLLTQEFESRISTLGDTLDELPVTDGVQEPPPVGEIWSITNHEAITSRSLRLIENATDEIILVIGDPNSVTDDIFDALNAATGRNVSVIVGVMDSEEDAAIAEKAPEADTFVSDLPWLPVTPGQGSAIITRLLLVDEITIVVGSRSTEESKEEAEQAVVGSGTSNGIVTILRHLLRAGFLEGREGAQMAANGKGEDHEDADHPADG